MLNPRKPVHRLLAQLLFRLPSIRRQWYECMQIYLPILAPAFHNNAAARLLAMRALQHIHKGNIEKARQIHRALNETASDGENPDKAFFHFLSGLAAHRSGHMERMAYNFNAARKYGHRFHLPCLLLGDYYFNVKHFVNKAEENYLAAIDCIYVFPPLTDQGRKALGACYAAVSRCRTMMHQYSDAQSSIRNAEQMDPENSGILHARALVHAALRQPEEARRCCAEYGTLDPDSAKDLHEMIELILEDRHPHFTALPIGDAKAIEAFWQFFLAHEEEILSQLRLDQRGEVFDQIKELLEATDPDDLETMTYYIKQTPDENRLYFGARYSLTNNALIDQLLAACPPELHKRWHIIRES